MDDQDDDRNIGATSIGLLIFFSVRSKKTLFSGGGVTFFIKNQIVVVIVYHELMQNRLLNLIKLHID